MTNLLHRFLFDDLDIRGAIVRLDSVWQQLLAGRDYPPPVLELLGPLVATSVLLADNLKQPGRITLQLRGEGPISLLLVDCNEELNLRGMARYAEDIESKAPAELLGRGQILLSLDRASLREPQQSFVPLEGESIASIFEHYLAQSEQLTSRFFLAVSPTAVAGLFLQKMPESAALHDSDAWTRIEALAATTTSDELLTLPAQTLLTRLFHQEPIRLFEAQPVTHNYPYDWEKVRNMLRTLGREEVYSNLQERGAILICDELSNHEYRFDKAAIDELFSNVRETPSSIH